MPRAARKPRTTPKNLPRRASKEVSKQASKRTPSRTPSRTPTKASTGTATKMPKIDILVESALWKRQTDVKSTLRRAIAQAAAVLSTPRAELVIVLTDDSAIRLLNRDWRGVDAATNVLSFPAAGTPGDPPLIGDIVLAYETDRTRGPRRAQAFRPSYRPPCRARLPAPLGIRSRAGKGCRGDGANGTHYITPDRNPRPIPARQQAVRAAPRARRADHSSFIIILQKP